MAYVNLPGTFATLVDGNLRQFVPNADPIALILGTAGSGFTESLYGVNNVGAALTEFGRTSEIGKAIVEARDGGSSNIFVMRLPGTAPSLTRLGSEHASAAVGDEGYTVTPVLASTEAGSRYGLAYRHARNYAPVAGAAASVSELVGELIIVDLEDESLVWYGDLAAGGAIEDFGLMDVTLDTVDQVSTTNGPEEMTLTVGGAATADGTLTLYIDGQALEVPLLLATHTTDILVATEIVSAAGLDANFAAFSFDNAAGTSAVVTITADGTTDVNGNLVHPSTHNRAGATARPFYQDQDGGTTGVVVTFTAITTDHKRAADVGIFPADPLAPFALTGGGTFIALEDVIGSTLDFDSLVNRNAFMGGAPILATFTAGDTGESISLMERYEKLYDVYNLLDFREFDIILPQGVAVDSNNTADMTGGERTDAGLDVLAAYPTPNTVSDVLGTLAIVEDCNTFSQVFYWDTDDDGTYNVSSDGSSAPANTVFHEVNFAHQLALFCYDSSEDFQFCHGVIGTQTPRSLSPRGIRQFFGCLPTYTYDPGTEEYVVAAAGDNGVGILGHKLIGGKYGYRFNLKNGGLPLTSDRFFDTSNSTSNLVKDENGVVVDLGKYISVVAAFGHLRNEYQDRAAGYLTNLANVYGGLITSLPVNVSPTAQAMPGTAMRYFMPSSVADEAAGARIVVMINDEGSPVIADAPTFALLDSDYTRLTTMRVVAKIVEEIRQASKPYFGKGMGTSKRLSHETAVQGVLQKNMDTENQNITAGTFIISQTRGQRVQGKMDLDLKLTPVFELRQINLKVGLSAGV